MPGESSRGSRADRASGPDPKGPVDGSVERIPGGAPGEECQGEPSQASKAPQVGAGMAQLVQVWQLGIEFVVAVVLFTVLGVWLDQRLGTVVLCTLLGLALGLGGGIWLLMRSSPRRPRGETRPPGSPPDKPPSWKPKKR